MRNVVDLYRRSVVDPYSGCWHWQGAKRKDGVPSIWAHDYDRKERRTMAGPRAVWSIANKSSPPGVVYRVCCRDCVNPRHMLVAKTRTDMIERHKAVGKFKTDAAAAARVDNLRAARVAAGSVDTPPELVIAVRNADPSETGRDIARRLGIGEGVVSRIRRGVSHAGVAA